MADTPSTDYAQSSSDVADSDQDQDQDQAQAQSFAEREKEILRVAQERMEQATEAETDVRRLALEDLQFISGKQWPDNIQQDRERDGRPCLVINRLPQFVQQVTNDQRQNRPAIKVHPVDDEADVETAKVIQGLIRHIEYNSNAEAAYDTGFESAAKGGFGYWRLLTDYADEKSFEQEIFIKRIRNPFAVFFDPFAQEPDGSDANWAFIVDDLSKEEYQARYPHSKLAAPEANWDAIGLDQPAWMHDGSARVAEYLYKDYEDTLIHLLNTGETIHDDEREAKFADAQSKGIDLQVVKSRTTKETIIRWCKINAIEVLEQTIWPGKFIPVVPVYGGEHFVNGKKILESVIRNAKDPQRMYNYWKSAETEAIALAPRAPFIVAEGQLEGYKNLWGTANRRNHAYLPYKPVSLNGSLAPPPERQAFEPAVQAITQAAMAAADDLKATTGLYDPSLGAQSNEVSGLAIQRRTNQSQTSNFHFIDNLTRSMRHTGRILIDLIPKIYDTARAVRIVHDDGSQKVIQINAPTKDDSGQDVIYSMDVGRYDVTVDTGPSFASRRQEAAASMMDFSRSVPQVAASCADLIAKNMDWPGAQDIADRLKKTLPPALQDDTPANKQIPPQVQAQMAQMGQMVEKLTEQVNEQAKIIETKRLELEHRERIEVMKMRNDAEIEMAKLGSQGDIALLHAQIKEMEHRLQLLQMNQPIDAPNDFVPEAADGGNYAGVGHVGGSPNPTGGPSPG